MSQSQAIRGSFLFFAGSARGGTAPLIAPYKDVAGNASSSILGCAGLKRKTVEIRGVATELAANPVVIEGTISETSPDKANWFPLVANIVAPGIYTIEIGAGASQPCFYEPELTFLRIRALASGGNIPVPGTFPNSIGATMAGVWEGDSWERRIKLSSFGKDLSDYKAV